MLRDRYWFLEVVQGVFEEEDAIYWCLLCSFFTICFGLMCYVVIDVDVEGGNTFFDTTIPILDQKKDWFMVIFAIAG